MEQSRKPAAAIPVLNRWVRGTLVAIAVGLITVFAIAAWLNPYETDGTARRMETHRQLHLPPCTFKTITGLPCPSCGMTTSFALLVRGDVWNSLKANAVGTLLAAFCLALIPWNLACAIGARPYLVWSLDRALTRVVIIFLILMLVRWVLVLAWVWASGVGWAQTSEELRRGENDTTFTAGATGASHPGRIAGHRLQRAQSALLPYHGNGSQVSA